MIIIVVENRPPMKKILTTPLIKTNIDIFNCSYHQEQSHTQTHMIQGNYALPHWYYGMTWLGRKDVSQFGQFCLSFNWIIIICIYEYILYNVYISLKYFGLENWKSLFHWIHRNPWYNFVEDQKLLLLTLFFLNTH